MKKSDFKYDISDLIAKSDVEKEATMFPFAVGNEYHFILSESLFSNRAELIDGVLCKWTEAITDDGVGISIRQLTRRNNGLVLDGKTIKERLASFVGLFDANGHLALKVTKVIERKFIQPSGAETTSRYLKFVKM